MHFEPRRSLSTVVKPDVLLDRGALQKETAVILQLFHWKDLVDIAKSRLVSNRMVTTVDCAIPHLTKWLVLELFQQGDFRNDRKNSLLEFIKLCYC